MKTIIVTPYLYDLAMSLSNQDVCPECDEADREAYLALSHSEQNIVDILCLLEMRGVAGHA